MALRPAGAGARGRYDAAYATFLVNREAKPASVAVRAARKARRARARASRRDARRVRAMGREAFARAMERFAIGSARASCASLSRATRR